jgi:Fur family ferric uptake transcriptional regulator
MLNDFQNIIVKLKKVNFKITNERKRFINLLFTLSAHFYFNDLVKLGSNTNPPISRASIYRNFPIFKKIGFIKEIEPADGKHLYEVVKDKNHHEHLVCTECNKTYEFDDSKLNGFFQKIFKKYGFIPKSHNLKLCGICPNCQSSKQNKKKFAQIFINKK